jgi:hypothetical protein
LRLRFVVLKTVTLLTPTMPGGGGFGEGRWRRAAFFCQVVESRMIHP